MHSQNKVMREDFREREKNERENLTSLNKRTQSVQEQLRCFIRVNIIILCHTIFKNDT